jgi:hypothetical protein
VATITDSETLDVYKFHGSGLVALCAEVTSYAVNGDFERWGVDLDSAEYVNEDGLHIVRFRKKKEESSEPVT